MHIFNRGLLAAVLASGTLSVQAQNNPPPDGPPPGPPPEAVAACKGKTEGAKVQFKGRHDDTVSGVCKKMGELLAAMPEGMPPPPQQR